MHPEPIMNDPENPLISILIYNYDGKCLKPCLETILAQSVLNNIEIIIIDDSTSDGSWDTAVDFSYKYNGIITLTRNKKVLGPEINRINAIRMARGKYSVSLSLDNDFRPEYIRQCILVMESDPFAEFFMIHRTLDAVLKYVSQHSTFSSPANLPNISNKPLVSILIFNYNYGRYLRECLDSALAQTYKNIEICFSDNASTDESWEIALEYARKYPGMIYMTRNRINFGSDANFSNCLFHTQGKYFVELCSDDALIPEFVAKCVAALEANPSAGFAMVHREIIDEHGNKTDEPPFYNQSCLIPGEEQAAVYMLAAVNPSITQVMYRKKVIYGRGGSSSIAGKWYGTRIQDFKISCEFPIVYIKEPLMLHRVHSQSDSFNAASNLLEVIGPLVLAYQYSEIAAPFNLTKVVGRLPQAIEKLANLSLRYCVRALCADDEARAFRYFHLAAALMPAIVNDQVFVRMQEYWNSDSSGKSRILEGFKSTSNLVTRSVSYDPPPGSMPLEV